MRDAKCWALPDARITLGHCGSAQQTSNSPSAPASARAEKTPTLEGLGNATVIAYGQTQTFTYKDDGPRYDTYGFQATDGDNVTISVTSSNGGVPYVWLVQSSTTDDYGTLTSSTPTSGAANLSYVMPGNGRFYIAVREANFKTAKFTLTLSSRVGQRTVEH